MTGGRRVDVISAAVMRRRIAAMDPLAAAALVAAVVEQVHGLSWVVAALDRGPAELWDGLVIGGVDAWQVAASWCAERRWATLPGGPAIATNLVAVDAIAALRRRALVCGATLEHTWPAEQRAAAGAELDALAGRLPRRCRAAVESEPAAWDSTLTTVRRVGVGLAMLEATACRPFAVTPQQPARAPVPPADHPSAPRPPDPAASRVVAR